MVYETEKALKEVGDKINASDKEKIESQVEALKKAMETDNIDDIKQKTEELTNAFHVLSQKLYEAASQQQGAEQSENTEKRQDENVVDADYEVVDDDEK